MLWFVVIALFCLLICWLLIAPLELKVDTTIPVISVSWKGIGSGMLIYEAGEWRVSLSILFFQHRWSLAKMIFSGKRKNSKKTPGRNRRFGAGSFRKIWNVLRSFEIIHWQLAVDTGDPSRNAMLYPANFLPGLRQHLFINFHDKNYLVLIIRNAAWRMIYAYLK